MAEIEDSSGAGLKEEKEENVTVEQAAKVPDQEMEKLAETQAKADQSSDPSDDVEADMLVDWFKQREENVKSQWETTDEENDASASSRCITAFYSFTVYVSSKTQDNNIWIGDCPAHII